MIRHRVAKNKNWRSDNWLLWDFFVFLRSLSNDPIECSHFYFRRELFWAKLTLQRNVFAFMKFVSFVIAQFLSSSTFHDPKLAWKSDIESHQLIQWPNNIICRRVENLLCAALSKFWRERQSEKEISLNLAVEWCPENEGKWRSRSYFFIFDCLDF